MLVDANVFKGYFQVTIGSAHSLNGCPKELFDSINDERPVFHDSDGIIENEWRAVVDQEWFDSWLASQLESGNILYVDRVIDLGTERRLASLGFPKGRDIVYVRTGLGAVQLMKSACDLISEDIDFYDPKQKGCHATNRRRMLSNSSGAVAKFLKTKQIYVRCVP